MQPGELISIQGLVQGVGFRPTVARLARQLGYSGWVCNTPEGVLLALHADKMRCDAFLNHLQESLPPLAHIDGIERKTIELEEVQTGFEIRPSTQGAPRTAVLADVVTCKACAEEIFSPQERRFRYPFTNCTHCGPRASIIQNIPYDRSQTTMAAFVMCEACRTEYEEEADRRYHAQPIACHECGPKVWLETATPDLAHDEDAIAAAASLLRQGKILAIKGIGGFQLCCDATQPEVVARLRERKRRPHKPFAMMVRDLDVLEAYTCPTSAERKAISHSSGPIVLLARHSDSIPEKESQSEVAKKPVGAKDVSLPTGDRHLGRSQVAENVAPGQARVGVMLPTTPLHALLLDGFEHPIVCTSGNLSAAPQCIENAEARAQLASIADAFLTHNREIALRIDDSVVQVVENETCVLRYARGFAPLPLPLPPGFSNPPAVLAMGAQQKSAYCLLSKDHAVLSPYIGDLESLAMLTAYQQSLHHMLALHQFVPAHIAVDLHPSYEATALGHDLAQERDIPVSSIQHHHAHVAACLAENKRSLNAPPVLGIVLDGLGAGEDGQLWGGEFLIADYRQSTRWGTLKPVAMLGGDKASREPWRNLYAHLMAALGWEELTAQFGDLALVDSLSQRPRTMLDRMLAQGTHAPLASSCGRLFDAVAAALGLFAEHTEYEGQAAMALEALVTSEALAEAAQESAYAFDVVPLGKGEMPCLEPAPMWRSLLEDLAAKQSPSRIAARFHVALTRGIVQMTEQCKAQYPMLDTVVLSGGVWHNQPLFSLVAPALRQEGFCVMSHRLIPPNDGGIALGQAIIAAARLQPEGAC